MKCSLFLLLVTGSSFFATSAHAQFAIAPVAGLSVANGIYRQQYGYTREHTRAIRGLKAGLLAEIPVSRTLHLQPALLYSRNGFSAVPFSYDNNKLDIRSIELPLSLAIRTAGPGKSSFVFNAGPFLGINTSAMLGEIEASKPNDLVKGTYFGGTMGIGFAGGSGVFVRTDMQAGFGDVMTENIQVIFLPLQASISVGYLIRAKPRVSEQTGKASTDKGTDRTK
ncbi:hypothetical protein GCM10023093_02590 [Nemorincola caseinilytica]|uniref:PorT family protein n=1 Tax=Nemorincola caseinilytica TaxID=2054315 RepID=A0ABP8N5A7_9BACT